MKPHAFAMVAALLGAGCASAGARPGAAGDVSIPPGGRADGRLSVPTGARTSLRLSNRGPGRADFVVRLASGVLLQSGALDSAEIVFTPTAPVVLVVVLDAYPDAAATVRYAVDGAPDSTFVWNVAPR